jgi:hypothetical protein
VTTLNIPISASSDDGSELNTGVVQFTDLNSGAVNSLDSAGKWAALRFLNVTVPKGAVINSASISIVPINTGEDEPEVTLFSEAADSPATISAVNFNISGRPLSSASVFWSSTNLGATGSSRHSSPDISSLIQERVDSSGWVAGNPIMILIRSDASTIARDLKFWAFDNGSLIPELDIDYTISATITGTATASITEADIVSGGKTIIITLTGTTWIEA